MAHERFSTKDRIPVWVRHEHLARYEFAAGFVHGRTVIDAACGSGLGTRYFANAGAAKIFAIDLSSESIESAIRSNTFESVHFAVGDASNTQLPAHAADVFISLETIEHLPDDVAFLTEVSRVLKQDGVFICSTPNRRIVNPGKAISDKPLNPFHLREYETKEFSDLLGRFFDKIELYGQNPQSLMGASILNTMGKILPFYGAVRAQQALKLPRFLYDRIEHHCVMPASKGCLFEYDVAVCSGVRHSATI